MPLRRTRVTLSITVGLAMLVMPLLFWVGSRARTRTLGSPPGTRGAAGAAPAGGAVPAGVQVLAAAARADVRGAVGLRVDGTAGGHHLGDVAAPDRVAALVGVDVPA